MADLPRPHQAHNNTGGGTRREVYDSAVALVTTGAGVYECSVTRFPFVTELRGVSVVSLAFHLSGILILLQF